VEGWGREGNWEWWTGSVTVSSEERICFSEYVIVRSVAVWDRNVRGPGNFECLVFVNKAMD